MSLKYVLILIAYSFGMASGQILFKLAAKSVQQADASANPVLAYVNVYLAFGMALYFGLTILWVWLLRFVPLSQAFPFMALTFVLTPLLAQSILGEDLSHQYFVGMAFIALGIVVIARQ